jgi:hypothetical protein
MKLPLALLWIVCILIISSACGSVPLKNNATSTPTEVVEDKPTPLSVDDLSAYWGLPDFIPTVRAYSGGGYDGFQCASMVEMGLQYVQGIPDFSWVNIEPQDDEWKWDAMDAQMDLLAGCGMKTIAFLIIPKLGGLHWDESIQRDDQVFLAEYEEYAYELVNRYHAHPAWSGLIAVWGGSADVWDHANYATDPEVVVPLLNTAYDGIKRADPATIVIGFNFATTAHSIEDWEAYHERAFSLSPKFDWYGLHSHGVPVVVQESPQAYTGVTGLVNVRKFLDEHGYEDTPLWVNEGGLGQGEGPGGMPEHTHAEQVVESFIVSRALDVNLRGWVYYEYFCKTRLDGGQADMGLMSALDEQDPPAPRLAWYAYQTLIKTIDFFDYDIESQLSGEFNQPDQPIIYQFARRDNSSMKLWVVFSPWGVAKGEAIIQDVVIEISTATQATVVTMLGEESIVAADSEGNIVVTSTSSPVYILTGK